MSTAIKFEFENLQKFVQHVLVSFTSAQTISKIRNLGKAVFCA